jgi:hypothetical protein
MTTLLVFVHGFMGSCESFQSFPQDLKAHLTSSGHPAEFKIYPTYDTSGSNQIQVQKFMDWLLLNGSTTVYRRVVILSHSMGGLLSADAYNSLYSVRKSEKDKSFFQKWFSYNYDPEHDPNDIRTLVNITGLFSFDSPFFGLERSVIHTTGVSKGQTLARTIDRQTLISLAPNIADMLPDRIHITPMSDLTIPVSTEMFKRSLNLSPSSVSSFPIPTTGAIGSADLLASTGLAKPIIVAGMTLADHLVKYNSFLDPLTNSHQSCLERVELIIQEQSKSKVHFRAFFNKLDKGQLFCKEPPEALKPHFIELNNSLQDEIDAHMLMFSEKAVGNEKYSWFIEEVAKHILHTHQ